MFFKNDKIKNTLIYKLLRNVKWVTIYAYKKFIVYFYIKLKSIGIINNQFKQLSEFENIHKGERCFIIATGPSLTIEDVEKLRNEYTFTMNSFVKALNKISFVPTYYGIQDGNVYKALENDLKESNLNNIFMASSFDTDMPQKEQIPDNILSKAIFYFLNVSYHRISACYFDKYYCRFSDDITNQIYDGYTIAYSLLQIAIYMGFKEIYLLGTDCNYISNVKNFEDHGARVQDEAKAGTKMIEAYKIAKKYADAHGIKIYNATRGGKLEVFERVDLDEVIGIC